MSNLPATLFAGRDAAWLNLADTDVSADLEIQPPVAMQGRVLSEQPDSAGSSTTALVRRVVIHLNPVPELGRGLAAELPTERGVTTDSSGTFQSQVYVPPGRRLWVGITNLPDKLYIGSLRYNGVVIQGDEFVLDPSAATQNVDVICSTDFGVLSGVAGSPGGDPVSILLAPWPNDGTYYPSNLMEARNLADGTFRLDHLRPGHYKAIFLPSADRQEFEAPFRLILEALPRGQDLNIVAGPNEISQQ